MDNILIPLNINGKNRKRLELNQYDVGIPIEIKLIHPNGTPYTITENDTVKIEWGLPGNLGFIDTDVNTNGNSVVFQLKRESTLNSGLGSFNVIVEHKGFRKGTFRTDVEIVGNSINEVTIHDKIVISAIEDLQERIEEGKNVVTNIAKAIGSGDLDEMVKIKLVNDIAGTKYKAGAKIDVNYLQLIQAQKYATVMWKLNNNENIEINCQGDSLTYGHDISSEDRVSPIPPHTFSRAKITYPDALSSQLNQVYPGKITVVNRGYSGDTCERSYNRWKTNTSANLTIFMLGTNDSRSSGCTYVGDIEKYLYWYEQLIVRELIWGKAVIIIKPPRTLWANDKKVEAFSNGLELLCSKYGIPLIDPTPFISSHNTDIWSDKTAENSKLICTHLTSKGYSLLASGVSSTLIGESIVNKKKISNGDTLIAREQVDGIKYINNVLNLEVSASMTPFERTDNKSIILRMGDKSKAIYSFYTESENLMVIPNLYAYANKSFKMTLDFGLDQPYMNLITQKPGAHIGDKIPSTFTYQNKSNGYCNRSYLKLNKIDPLMIVRKGWHTIIIEAEDAIFSGLEFISYPDWKSYISEFGVKTVGEVLQVNYSNLHGEILGKAKIPMPSKTNKFALTSLIPDNFRVLNRSCVITNENTMANVAVIGSNKNDLIIEVVNNGALSAERVCMVDFRLFGYFS